MPLREPTSPGEPKHDEIPAETLALLREYKVDPEQSELISKSKQEIEAAAARGRRSWGAVPHFNKRAEILQRLPEEMQRLTQNGEHFDPSQVPDFIAASYGQAPVLFEMKFGTTLSEFADKILAQYPDLNEGKSEEEQKRGQEITVFGLSGSGKSTAVEAIREQLGEHTIVMDSDTVRYNLLAKALKDVEVDRAGASMDELKNNLLHNNISGPLYLMLNHVTKTLKERGYTIITSSTQPSFGADKSIYIEHPDGIDPSNDEQVPLVPKAGPEETADQATARQAAEAKINALAKTLHERTAGRVNGADDYDWDHAETVIDFNNMKPVTVQVPEFVHGIFLQNAKRNLAGGKVMRIPNPKVEDPAARKRNFQEQFAKVL